MIGARPLCLGLLIALGLPVPDAGRADDVAPGVSTSVDCGTMALYTLLRAEGKPADLPGLNRLLPEAHRAGYSLRELREAARSSGLSTTGVKLGAADFPLDRPALAHLERDGHGHYVVVRPVGHSGTLVQVIDPGRGPLVIESADLLASPEWTGRALIPDRASRVSSLAPWGLAAIPFAFWYIMGRRRSGDIAPTAGG